ncbi:hypothetical protein [Anoxybacteroides amylolyticum]|uniref:Uncharacterized protein n=1 Tax=Anoxybacteroides amylolyticum TaxID=294699 RepID=A0A160F143_9BACL|nr:hypothetical protein [Anoxybacillus amylolyticus]ANB59827.1 hypothetical protein GFC30_2105 [Anoxybacillus amylolyticus]
MTKKYNRKGSNNQSGPTEPSLTEEVRSGDNSKGNKRKKSQNDKTDLAE